MKKSTHCSKRKRKAAIKRRHNRLKFLRKELASACDNAVDRISELPDEILIFILSRLTLQEAIATGVLSTRWRDLYTYINHLKFPPLILKRSHFCKVYLRERQEEKFSNYIYMINHTLDSYRGNGVLKEFRVHMHSLEGANIERWLEFALARQVEIIDIEMHCIDITRGHYTLQLPKLIGTNGGRPGLECLKQVSFRGIHVDDKEVELLLSNVPLLESLSIALSKRLRYVSIVGHYKLNHFDISCAENLELIEIGDMINLVCFKCYGQQYPYVLRLNNVPKLIEFHTSEHRKNTLAETLPRIPAYICDQLQVLKLWTHTPYIKTYLPAYELINIKHLELKVLMKGYVTTYPLFYLIEACTSLEELEIKFLWHREDTKFQDREPFTPCMKKISPNLKKLMLSGYLGCPTELDLASVIMSNAAALEELIVEPSHLTPKIRRLATTQAWKHFPPITPVLVNLIII